MSRTLIRFHDEQATRWAVQFGSRLAVLPINADSTGELLSQHWDTIWSVQENEASVNRNSVRLCAPVTPNQQFICQGVNYRSHVEESGLKISNFPFNTIFTKAPSCITAADAAVVRPAHVSLLDYEVELGLVLRRPLPPGTTVKPDELGHWLAGVTIVNDLSARDVQLPQGQFYKGKSYRGFGPVGPGLVLLSHHEWTRWPELHMRLSVNGQPRQDAYCREMIYSPATTLTELAGMHDVNAGDLIATGTPAGCAARSPGKLTMWVLKHLVSDAVKWRLFISKAQSNPAYLRPADRISASIRTDDGSIDLGEQATVIVAP
jgi:2-keto-4-pentenoate hydratase/2-oxohepta-3-ene-1,7-dioic acid hydratase in catechol pathway